MQQRKLIKLGNSSFAIALPKEWVTKSGLKKGEDVFLEENGNGEIIVSSRFKKMNGEKETLIQIDNKNEKDLKKRFTGAYIQGNSIFNFAGESVKEKTKAIKEIISKYVGCEIIEENEKNLKVKDFFNFEEININSFIKRMDNNIAEMLGIVIQILEREKITKQDLTDLYKIDEDINKFYFLMSRIMILGMNNPSLINKLKIVPQDLFNNWWLSFHLEHTGDDIKNIAEKIKATEINANNKKALLPILNKIKLQYENSLKAFYAKDIAKAHDIMEQGKDIPVSCDELIRGKDAFLSLVGERLKEINNASYQTVKIVSYVGS